MTNKDENDNGGGAPTESSDSTPKTAASGRTPLKEGMTTFIAIVITVLTVCMLIVMFYTGEKDDQKDILLLTLGLFGTVLGYYFGRVPAERRAERAEDTADEAEAAARDAIETSTLAQQQRMLEELGRTEAETKLLDALDTNRSVIELLEPSTQQARATLSSGGQAAAGTAESVAAFKQLEALSERLRRQLNR